MATAITALGAGTSVDYTNASNPVLQIPFSALAAAIAWDALPTAGTENLEPWIAGIVQNLATFTSNETDEASNLVTAIGFKGIATRDNTSKTTWTYNLTFYQVDSTPSVPDGDGF